MKKQTAGYIIFAAGLLLVLICGFLGIKYVNNGYLSVNQNGDRTIYKFSPDTIDEIKIKNSSGEYSIIKDNNDWTINKLRDKKLVESSILDTVNVLCSIQGRELKEINDSVKFSTNVEILTNWKDASFSLAHDGSNYYLRNKKNEIFSISQIAFEVAARDMDFYRDRALSDIKSLSQGGENRFKSVSYRTKDEDGIKQMSVRVKNADEIQRYGSESPYMMDKPYLKPVDAERFEKEVLYAIPEIKISKFVSEDVKDFQPYGLDNASRGELTVLYDEKKFTLYIGNTMDDGSFYVSIPESKSVYTVEKSKLLFLDTECFDYLEKSLFAFSDDYVKNAEIFGFGLKYTFTSSADKYYLNNDAVSKETFENLKNEIKKIEFKNILNKASGNKVLSINIYGKDGRVIYYEFYKSQEEKYIVSENGKLFFGLDENKVNDFLEYLMELNKTLI